MMDILSSGELRTMLEQGMGRVSHLILAVRWPSSNQQELEEKLKLTETWWHEADALLTQEKPRPISKKQARLIADLQNPSLSTKKNYKTMRCAAALILHLLDQS